MRDTVHDQCTSLLLFEANRGKCGWNIQKGRSQEDEVPGNRWRMQSTGLIYLRHNGGILWKLGVLNKKTKQKKRGGGGVLFSASAITQWLFYSVFIKAFYFTFLFLFLVRLLPVTFVQDFANFEKWSFFKTESCEPKTWSSTMNHPLSIVPFPSPFFRFLCGWRQSQFSRPAGIDRPRPLCLQLWPPLERS